MKKRRIQNFLTQHFPAEILIHLYLIRIWWRMRTLVCHIRKRRRSNSTEYIFTLTFRNRTPLSYFTVFTMRISIPKLTFYCAFYTRQTYISLQKFLDANGLGYLKWNHHHLFSRLTQFFFRTLYYVRDCCCCCYCYSCCRCHSVFSGQMNSISNEKFLSLSTPCVSVCEWTFPFYIGSPFPSFNSLIYSLPLVLALSPPFHLGPFQFVAFISVHQWQSNTYTTTHKKWRIYPNVKQSLLLFRAVLRYYALSLSLFYLQFQWMFTLLVFGSLDQFHSVHSVRFSFIWRYLSSSLVCFCILYIRKETIFEFK